MSRMIDDEETLKDNGLIEMDGCNVAECNSFLNEYEFSNNLNGGYYKEKNLCECGVQGTESYPFFCKDNPDCYFKQLQRAKAENEKLKETIKLYAEINENDTAYNAVLLKENKELKMKNNELLTRLSEKYGVFK